MFGQDFFFGQNQCVALIDEVFSQFMKTFFQQFFLVRQDQDADFVKL